MDVDGGDPDAPALAPQAPATAPPPPFFFDAYCSEDMEFDDVKPDIKPDPVDMFYLFGDTQEEVIDVYPAPGVGVVEEPLVDDIPIPPYDEVQKILCRVKPCSVRLDRGEEERDPAFVKVRRSSDCFSCYSSLGHGVQVMADSK
jgi:hypothetical protein